MIRHGSSEAGSAVSMPSPGTIRIYYRSQTTLGESVAFDQNAGKRVPSKGKKVSDLAGGTVSVCFGTVTMRERRLTSLEGLRIYEKMHTLFLQDNCLLNLEHLGTQPDLSVLRAERNLIDDFYGTERCPKLKEVYLDGNPIERKGLFHVMTCLSLNPNLVRVNGKVLSKQEKQLVAMLDRPVMRMALRQGWMLSAAPSRTAEVDLPVEEFFFRVDPAVEHLLMQGVPPASCNINVHHHLRRSYEMLATVRVQPTLTRHSSQACSSAGGQTASPPSASQSGPSRGQESNESVERGGGKEATRQPWMITNIYSHHRNLMSGSEPKSKWATVEPEQLESLSEQARGEAGFKAVAVGTGPDESVEEEGETSGDILNWKLSSLDFESPQKRVPSIDVAEVPEHGEGSLRREGDFETLLPANGLSSQGSRTSPLREFRSQRRRSGSLSPNKMPQSPAVSTGLRRSRRSVDTGVAVQSGARDPNRTADGSRSIVGANELSPPSTSPARRRASEDKMGSSGVASGLDDDADFAAMLHDVKKASSAYADVESWVNTESVLNGTNEHEVAQAPLSQLLSGFSQSPARSGTRRLYTSHHRAQCRSSPDKDVFKERESAGKQESGGHDGSIGRDLNTTTASSHLRASSPSRKRMPWTPDTHYSPPKNYPFGVKEKRNKRSGAEPDDWDVRAWAVGDVGHPGPISRLQRTVYGKILLDNCRAWLLDWKFVSMGRQRQRLASRMRREEDNLTPQEILVRDALGMALGGGGRVFRDVTIPRVTDEAFRIWLLNAAWLICKEAMRQRIRWRIQRSSLCKWKLYIGVLAQGRKSFSSVSSQRIAMVQRCIGRSKDVVCHEQSIFASLSRRDALTRHQYAMNAAVPLFRRSRSVCLKEHLLPTASFWLLDERLQLYISHQRSVLTNSFRIWRNFARDIKFQALTERVREVESRLGGILEASLLQQQTPGRDISEAHKGKWDRAALEALVHGRFHLSKHDDDEELKAEILDMLLVVTGNS